MTSEFKEIEAFAKENNVPIIRPLSREILINKLQSVNPKTILEVGTAIGFSGSLMLAETRDSTLTTIEIDENSFNIAKNNFKKMGVSDRVTQILGDATEVIEGLKQKFDFIFLDGPKSQYVKQLPFLIDLLNIGGILLADNVLFMGKVLSGEYPKHKHRTMIFKLRQFIADVQSDKRLKSEIVDIEDGLLIAHKISD